MRASYKIITYKSFRVYLTELKSKSLILKSKDRLPQPHFQQPEPLRIPLIEHPDFYFLSRLFQQEIEQLFLNLGYNEL